MGQSVMGGGGGGNVGNMLLTHTQSYINIYAGGLNFIYFVDPQVFFKIKVLKKDTRYKTKNK